VAGVVTTRGGYALKKQPGVAYAERVEIVSLPQFEHSTDVLVGQGSKLTRARKARADGLIRNVDPDTLKQQLRVAPFPIGKCL
jgi:hypothetical protein